MLSDFAELEILADKRSQDAFGASIRDAEPEFKGNERTEEPDDEMGLPPTQRLSQVRQYGLFD